MKIKRLKLKGFRNYVVRELEFDPEVTVVVGPNASGKTNILEAVYMLATGESFQAQKIEEMVNWEGEVGHITGLICNQTSKLKIQNSKFKTDGSANADDCLEGINLGVTLTRGVVQGKRTLKRRYLVNGVGRRKRDFVGNFYAVVFRPQDLRLVEGSPERRRTFMDGVLVQVDSEYRRSLMSYEKALRRRNRVLVAVREGETTVTALSFWNQLLEKEGGMITQKRQELMEFINEVDIWGHERQVRYQSSVVTAKRQQEYLAREIAAGHTLIGPHKDDVQLMSNDKFQMTNEIGKSLYEPGSSIESGAWRDLAVHGSRGEQRMAVLWLKLAEMTFIENKTGQKPVLLLDDIFSELDDKHDALVMEMAKGQQTVITTTDMREKFKELGWEVVEIGEMAEDSS